MTATFVTANHAFNLFYHLVHHLGLFGGGVGAAYAPFFWIEIIGAVAEVVDESYGATFVT